MWPFVVHIGPKMSTSRYNLFFQGRLVEALHFLRLFHKVPGALPVLSRTPYRGPGTLFCFNMELEEYKEDKIYGLEEYDEDNICVLFLIFLNLSMAYYKKGSPSK